jgi:sterol desaturase/sphingolipid hydroxylase (fatty acid hydroxylase superfamily)
VKSLFELDFSDPLVFALISTLFAVIVLLRYLAFSGMYHYLFLIILRERFSKRYLHKKPPPRSQMMKEIAWSAWASAIFGVFGTAMLLLWQTGHTQLYIRISERSLYWLPLSLLIALLIHETYYYWLHRWMHRPGIYHLLHKVHHDSVVTSSWTSFSFHPLESLLQALIVPAILVLVPMHISVLIVFLIIMTISAIINHAGVEVYSRGFARNWLGRWIIGAAHHDLHHKQFRYNYGLYFTFWDKWMNTESPDFKDLIKRKTS